MRAYTVRRQPADKCWNAVAMDKFKGTPQDPKEGVGEEVGERIGESDDEGWGDGMKGYAREIVSRDFYITRKYWARYGPTKECPGCEDLKNSGPRGHKTRRPHDRPCRKRFEGKIGKTEEGREYLANAVNRRQRGMQIPGGRIERRDQERGEDEGEQGDYIPSEDGDTIVRGEAEMER